MLHYLMWWTCTKPLSITFYTQPFWRRYHVLHTTPGHFPSWLQFLSSLLTLLITPKFSRWGNGKNNSKSCSLGIYSEKYERTDGEPAWIVNLLIPVPTPNLLFCWISCHCCYMSVEMLAVARAHKSGIAHVEECILLLFIYLGRIKIKRE